MDSNSLAVNGMVVADLRSLLQSGTRGLNVVPSLVREIINGEMWRERVEPGSGQLVPFESFAAFVAAPPLEGLGADIQMLKRVCANDKDVLDLIDRETTNPVGANQHTHNISTHLRHGTSEQYALRKLRRDAPTLHARVLSRELSAHAAMVEAGFRDPTVTIPRPVPKAARRLRGIYSPDELRELIAALEKEEHA